MYLEEYGNTGIPGEWMFELGEKRVVRCKQGIKGDTCDEGSCAFLLTLCTCCIVSEKPIFCGSRQPWCRSCCMNSSALVSECALGEWGADCALCCHCGEGTCHPLTGECSKGCGECWLGGNCQTSEFDSCPRFSGESEAAYEPSGLDRPNRWLLREGELPRQSVGSVCTERHFLHRLRQMWRTLAALPVLVRIQGRWIQELPR